MPDEMKNCQECGASIYPEHLDRGLAGFIAGKLLCSVCRASALGSPAAPPAAAGATAAVAAPTPAAAPSPAGGADEPIQLVDLNEVTTPVSASDVEKTSAFGGARDDFQLSRQLSHGRNASRCRIFHTRITEGALGYLNEQINEWCDQNPQIEIKFATSTVGAFEGKQHVEHHLILTLFY